MRQTDSRGALGYASAISALGEPGGGYSDTAIPYPLDPGDETVCSSRMRYSRRSTRRGVSLRDHRIDFADWFGRASDRGITDDRDSRDASDHFRQFYRRYFSPRTTRDNRPHHRRWLSTRFAHHRRSGGVRRRFPAYPRLAFACQPASDSATAPSEVKGRRGNLCQTKPTRLSKWS